MQAKGTKLNSLLYGDDLVILSKSKTSLDNCLKVLECFNAEWFLIERLRFLFFRNLAKT